MRYLISVVFVIALGLDLISAQIPKTNWQPIETASSTGFTNTEFPRVASFQNGDYVVVYVIPYANSPSTCVSQIFYANGSISVAEAPISDRQDEIETLPTVITFTDNTFLVAWRVELQSMLFARRFNRDGTARGPSFQISQANGPSTAIVPFQLAVVADNSFLVVYSSNTFIVIARFTSDIASVDNKAYSVGMTDSHTSVTIDEARSLAYITMETDSSPLTVVAYNYVNPLEPLASYLHSTMGPPKNPFAVMHSPNILSVIWTEDDTEISIIQHTAIPLPLDPTPQNFYSVSQTVYLSYLPQALSLNNGRIFVAFEGLRDFDSQYHIIYRLARLDSANSNAAVSIGPEILDLPGIDHPHLIALGQSSDIVVVARNSSTTALLQRVLTFCGNGVLDLNEQCDGTASCDSNCRCAVGTQSTGGRCLDVCDNSVVTGNEECDGGQGCQQCRCTAGFLPSVPRALGCQQAPADFYPSVGPTLDCVTDNGAALTAYFSYINEDGFDQSIQLGPKNSFSPDIASDRITFFRSGSSLTYPVSPYIPQIPKSVQSITWILGTFNLTVDLSNTTLISCPEAPVFILRLDTNDMMYYDHLDLLLSNFAQKYGISFSRISATYSQINSSPPEAQFPNKRSVQQLVIDPLTVLFQYEIFVTVEQANTTDETSSRDVFNEFFDDLKNETRADEVKEELTNGLEEINPQVKEITPAPTGVSVRSERFDPPDAPVGSFQPSEPPSVSLAEIILPSFVAWISFCILLF